MGLETAAVAAIVGGALSAGGAATNFVQAGKQRRAAEKAADDAGKALEAARNKLQVNYLRGLSIQKEPYERAREAGISTAAQVLQAAQEGSQRGVAAGATRAQLAQQNLENTNRIAMGQELQGLQRAAALEDRRLQSQQANIDLAEARGFQNMAADARDRQRALNQAGARGLLGAGQSLMKVPGLYGGGGGVSINDTAIESQIESTRNPNSSINPNFGVESQVIIDPESLNQRGLFDNVTIFDEESSVIS
tara:strand:+ start:2700 stop:3449 length:750 start_codon:yes stop_codon:yes gene_type:complete